MRALFSPLFIIALLLLSLPFTVLAELWAPIRADFDTDSFYPVIAWSRFCMGGGAFAVALIFGAAAVLLASARTGR